MKGIMTEEVIPRLQSKFELKSMYFKTAMTQGIGESFLAELIKDWEEEVYSNDLSLAYLPSPGIVKLRLSSPKGKKDQKKIDALFKQLETRIPQYFYGYNSDTLSFVIGNILKERQFTIGTVESCTAGKVASEITKTPGASEYFMGSLLTYSNKLKEELANVPKALINEKGSVCEEVARAMAEGGKLRLGVDVCISATGIAGPTGGTEEKPVGLVWIAIATPKTTIARKFHFGQHRERNIHMTTLCALNLLRNSLEL